MSESLESVEFMAQAAAEGLSVQLPSAFELQIDIDSEMEYSVFYRNWVTFCEEVEKDYRHKPAYTEKPSRSGLPHRHIRVSLPFKVDVWQRIAWQASLGSDPMRELLSGFRALRNDPNPTIFAEAAT